VVEDLILAAIHDAQGRAAARSAAELQKMSAELGLPADMKLPF
jgi:nucleoid-associated protein EbfC